MDITDRLIRAGLEETAPKRVNCCQKLSNLGRYPGRDGKIVDNAVTCKVCGKRHWGLFGLNRGM